MESRLYVAMNNVWMHSHGGGSTFSLPMADKKEASLIRRLSSVGFIENELLLPGNPPRMTGHITKEGKEYCRKRFGEPPLELSTDK